MKFEDLETSIMTYINREFCRKLEDWRKWALPLAVRMYVPSLKDMYLKNLDKFKTMGLVKDDNTICIDNIYQEASNIARSTGDIKCNIPLIGEVTFSANDVDCLYNIIKQEEQSRLGLMNTATVGNNII